MITTAHNTGNGTPRHPIGVVSRRTGLSIHVLRAWERRYGVVKPARTPGRQRLYTDADVTRLRLLRQATQSGRTIGQVARLSTPELLALIGEDAGAGNGGNGADEEDDEGSDAEPDEAGAVVAACLGAGEALDDAGLHAHLTRAAIRMRADEFTERVAAPLLERAGERWHGGRWQPAQEHVVSVGVRRVLQWLLSKIDVAAEAPTLVATTVAGEHHELGAMLASVVAADEGWRVVYLGPNLPARDIAAVAEARKAQAVALSIVYAGDAVAARRELGELRAGLPPGTELLVGGRAVANGLGAIVKASGATAVTDLPGLRTTLRALRGRAAGARASRQ